MLQVRFFFNIPLVVLKAVVFDALNFNFNFCVEMQTELVLSPKHFQKCPNKYFITCRQCTFSSLTVFEATVVWLGSTQHLLLCRCPDRGVHLRQAGQEAALQDYQRGATGPVHVGRRQRLWPRHAVWSVMHPLRLIDLMLGLKDNIVQVLNAITTKCQN